MTTTAFMQRPELRAAFEQGMKSLGAAKFYRVYADIYSGGAHGTMSSSKRFEQMAVRAGIMAIPEDPQYGKPEVQLDAPTPEIFTVYHRRFAGGYTYLEEELDDDEIGHLMFVANSLGDATAWTKEVAFHELLNRSGDATLPVGWDQLSLANDAHRILGSAETFDNAIAAAAPSEALLTTITQFFDNVPDERGRVSPVTNITIITNINNTRVWRQLLNVQTALIHPGDGTSMNANPAIPNRFSSDRFTVIGTPYMYGATKHICLGPQHGLYAYNRMMKEDMYKRDSPPGVTHRVRMRFSTGASAANQILVIG